MSQYRFLTGRDGQIQCDVLLRLENLKVELKPVFEKLNIDIQKLPIRNSTDSMPIKRQHSHFKAYYDGVTRNAIGDRYCRDVELLNYDF